MDNGHENDFLIELLNKRQKEQILKLITEEERVEK